MGVVVVVVGDDDDDASSDCYCHDVGCCGGGHHHRRDFQDTVAVDAGTVVDTAAGDAAGDGGRGTVADWSSSLTKGQQVVGCSSPNGTGLSMDWEVEERGGSRNWTDCSPSNHCW